MTRHPSRVLVVLPTAELLEEYKVHENLLASAQLDLKTIASYTTSVWASYEADHWQFYNPTNMATYEMVTMLVCQDVMAPAGMMTREDRHHLILVVASFAKRFYFYALSSLDEFHLTDNQLRSLDVEPWQGDDIAISFERR